MNIKEIKLYSVILYTGLKQHTAGGMRELANSAYAFEEPLPGVFKTVKARDYIPGEMVDMRYLTANELEAFRDLLRRADNTSIMELEQLISLVLV